MSGINVLNIAKDALLSHQTAINLTGANISNVDTPGYTRQRPIFNSLGNVDVQAGMVQLSVEVSQIQRVYDQFLEIQINQQSQDLGYNEAKKDVFEKIEIIFNETQGGGINELLNEFWNAWGDLSANPEGQAERVALVSAGQSIAQMFNAYSDDLVSMRNDTNEQIAELINQINTYSSEIADLNEKIIQTETGNGDTNDLRDKREELVRNLSEIMAFHSFEDDKGAINIFMSDGTSLVEGENVTRLSVEANASNSFYYDIILEDSPGVSVNQLITNGKLAGYLYMRDTVVGGYQNDLDALAATIVEKVNEQHRLGFDLEKNLGGDFFDATKTDAGTMAISSDIADDISKIAASATVNGDGDNATAIGALKDALLMNGNTSTFNTYYASFVGQIGQDVADASRKCEHYTSLMDQLTNKKEGISGVSVDEEMINLIKYQTGYNAAARLCAVADELIDTLLELGR